MGIKRGNNSSLSENLLEDVLEDAYEMAKEERLSVIEIINDEDVKESLEYIESIREQLAKEQKRQRNSG